MKNRALSAVLGCFVFGTGLLVVASAGITQQTSAEKPIPNDPAFRSFIDLEQVGDALVELDAARITDSALLLAHGEKILLRQHPGITSDKLFTVALRLAADKGDEPTLKRLDKALRGHASAELTAFLEVSLLRAKKVRKVDPFTNERVTPEARAIYSSMCREINLAKNLNDRPRLQRLHKTVTSFAELTTKQRENLKSQINESLVATTQEADPQEGLLAKLADESRAKQTAPPKK